MLTESTSSSSIVVTCSRFCFCCTGKTTLLRAVNCQLADKFSKPVMAVDSSAEIAGGGNIPHTCTGTARRMFGGKQQSKAELLQEAVANHGPEVWSQSQLDFVG